MTCRGKKRYGSASAARKVIDQAKDASKHGRVRRKERRSYLCRLCKGWHLTSKPYIDPLTSE